mmetsp:Transcript_466/g.480  ORF Transcript_466/g.480 Transcript_466/m.480 type:complete len:274 (+) Transcript_466:38-859(+)
MNRDFTLVAVALVSFFFYVVAASEEQSEQKKLLQAIHENPGVADHYVDLGNTLSSGEKVQLLPKSLTREEAYKLAIQIDPKNAVAFNNLGVTLPDLEATVVLGDGTKMTKQELFLKAIESDPKFGHAYNNLGETMQPDQKVNYPDGRSLGRKELFVKSIELDAEYPYAFNNLGVILADPNEDGSVQTVTLANGETLNSRSCFLNCIALGDHPALHHCYKNLGTVLDNEEVIQLPGNAGDRVNKEECLRRAKVLRQAAGIPSDDTEDSEPTEFF